MPSFRKNYGMGKTVQPEETFCKECIRQLEFALKKNNASLLLRRKIDISVSEDTVKIIC
jgi:hypothetical protein